MFIVFEHRPTSRCCK